MGFEVLTDVATKRKFFWIVTPCSSKIACLCWIFPWIPFLPGRWRLHVLPKRLDVSKLYGVTTQKTVRFPVTAVRNSNPKSTIMSSYIMGSHFTSTVQLANIFEMSAVPRIHVSTEPLRRYMALHQSLKSSAVLLLLYYKQTVAVIVPLPSAYCSTGSDSHSHHRCFLWDMH
jgi:hypothetical protein